jgi:hypothetical protein
VMIPAIASYAAAQPDQAPFRPAPPYRRRRSGRGLLRHPQEGSGATSTLRSGRGDAGGG